MPAHDVSPFVHNLPQTRLGEDLIHAVEGAYQYRGAPSGHQAPTMGKEFLHHQIAESLDPSSKHPPMKNGEMNEHLASHGDIPGMHVQHMMNELREKGSGRNFEAKANTPEASSFLGHHHDGGAHHHAFSMYANKGPYAGSLYSYHPASGWKVSGGYDTERSIHTLPGELHEAFHKHVPTLVGMVDNHLKSQ